MAQSSDSVIRLNVGGTCYCTTLATLQKENVSLLGGIFGADGGEIQCGEVLSLLPDGSYFLDRDGHLFRFVLDYLRSGKVTLPEPFSELDRLREEAKFFGLQGMVKQLNGGVLTPIGMSPRPRSAYSANGSCADGTAGHITIGYRGTFAFGRDGQADVKFRKLNRILVSGKAALCREVFGETLNESRDPDREGAERYTARLYLKHQSLEKACDTLADCGFKLAGACASGASGLSNSGSGLPLLPGPGSGHLTQDHMNPRSSGDYEEQRWAHYTEYVFFREPTAVSCKSPL